CAACGACEGSGRAPAIRARDAGRPQGILLVHLPGDQSDAARPLHVAERAVPDEEGAPLRARRRHLPRHADRPGPPRLPLRVLRVLAPAPSALAPGVAAARVQHPGRLRDAPRGAEPVSCARTVAAAALALAATHALPAAGGEEPLWEAGVGLTALDFPDYRGSSQSRAYVLPFPYFVYRGDFLRQDRRGLRGVFLENDRFDVNLSMGASLPVDSSRDHVREGMPNLRPTVEFGPSVAAA